MTEAPMTADGPDADAAPEVEASSAAVPAERASHVPIGPPADTSNVTSIAAMLASAAAASAAFDVRRMFQRNG